MKQAFRGFQAPYYTMVPNEVFDELLGCLSGAELKVVLYVCRRTFGFGKQADGISLSQLLSGVVAKDGRRLDGGCGIKSKATLLPALRALEARAVLVTVKRKSKRRGFETTLYRLNIVSSSRPEASSGAPPGTEIVPRGSTETGPTLGPKSVPGLGTKNVPTKERSSRESVNRKHHHPANPVSNGAGTSPEPNDDDASMRMTSTPVEVGVLDGLVSRMLALGLSPRLAAQKAAQYPPERIQEVLDRLPHRQAKNPAGYFVTELAAGDFAVPPALERRQRQADKAQPLQQQVTVQAAADVALNARIQAAVDQLTAAERDALMAEARRLVAQRSGRPVERVALDSPWVLGMFETLVEQRCCRPLS